MYLEAVETLILFEESNKVSDMNIFGFPTMS